MPGRPVPRARTRMARARSVASARAALAVLRARGGRVAFVPTMGALHEGHLSLVRLARRSADRVVVSVFVNPLQFGPREDFARYPRPAAHDRALLAAEGVDLVWEPAVADINGWFATCIHIGTEIIVADRKPSPVPQRAIVCGRLR